MPIVLIIVSKILMKYMRLTFLPTESTMVRPYVGGHLAAPLSRRDVNRLLVSLLTAVYPLADLIPAARKALHYDLNTVWILMHQEEDVCSFRQLVDLSFAVGDDPMMEKACMGACFDLFEQGQFRPATFGQFEMTNCLQLACFRSSVHF